MALQLIGIVCMATLLFICAMLSRARNTHYFNAAGQDVFKWLALVLAAFIVSRVLVMTDFANSEVARNLNSLVFAATILGIMWSVYRHGRTSR